jgi:hypothetical protein
MEPRKEEINIEIQTILHNFDTSETQTDIDGPKERAFTLDVFTKTNDQVHAERFRITPAHEPMSICI